MTTKKQFISTYPIQNMLPLLFLLSSTLLISTTTTTAAVAAAAAPLESFIQCFTNETNSPNLLYLPNSTSYQSILLSSAQNQRFLFSPSYTKPSLIVAATSPSHVQSTVTCARATHIRLRTLGNGHDYEAMSYAAIATPTTHPFITLDVGALRSISIDATAKTAWVQTGATVGELYYAIAKNHTTLAFPAGICPTVGVGGQISGGGLGTLMRKYATSADNVVDALLVDVNGCLLDRKAMGEDLFFAIRGAGLAGYGVIISFKLDLVDVPPVVTTFNVVRTLGQNATKLVARWQEVADKFDVNLFISVVVQVSKNDGWSNTIQITFNSYYLGRKEELLSLAQRSFPELGLKAADCSEVSWLQSVLFFYYGDTSLPVEILLNRNPGFNSSFKGSSDFVQRPIGENGLENIWRFLTQADGEPVTIVFDPLGGRMSEIREDAIAFPHRKGNIYNIRYLMTWVEREEEVTRRHLEWMKKLYEFMAPYVSSDPRAAYYNFKDIDFGRNLKPGTSYVAARVWGIKYFKGNFLRLAEVKGEVDPDDFFWNEQSIPVLKLAA